MQESVNKPSKEKQDVICMKLTSDILHFAICTVDSEHAASFLHSYHYSADTVSLESVRYRERKKLLLHEKSLGVSQHFFFFQLQSVIYHCSID